MRAMGTVFINPQSLLCGLIAGLIFIPTTIFDMVWGVRFLQEAHDMPYSVAVLRSASVPFGWIIGCPLLGWLTDRIGRRKPVIIGACLALLACLALILFAPPGLFPPYSLGLLTGIASGAAMIPYTVIKEANRPEHSGTATGVINFINFSMTAVLGPIFASRLIAASAGAERDVVALSGDLRAAALRRRSGHPAHASAPGNRPEGARAKRPANPRTRDDLNPQDGDLQCPRRFSSPRPRPRQKTAIAPTSSQACGPRKSMSATSSRIITSPISGTRSFLAGPTKRTLGIWKKLTDLFVEERKKGVLDVSQIPSSITAHDAGYIDKKNEVIVGLQTDAPLKRAIMPNGGLKMVTNGLEAFGFKPDPQVVEIFTKYRKTHNAGVFDAYTADVRRCRSSHVLTGLPDAYGRGRIIGDYRRVALYGVDRLIERKNGREGCAR